MAERRAFDAVAHDRDPLDHPLADEVVDDIVLGEAVVPHADRARPPVIADAERRLLHPVGQVGQHVRAFLGVHFDDAPGEVLVDVERLPPRRRVDADQRVDGNAVRPVVRLRVMQGGEAVAHLPHRRGERLVGGDQVGPHGVAADLRALLHVQDRHQRRVRQEGQVRVPLVGDAAFARRQPEQLRIAFGRAFLQVRMTFEFAEMAAEGDVLLRRHVLVREEQHLVLVQQPRDLRGVLRVRLAETNIRHFRAKSGGQPPDAPTVRRHLAPPAWLVPGSLANGRQGRQQRPVSRQRGGSRVRRTRPAWLPGHGERPRWERRRGRRPPSPSPRQPGAGPCRCRAGRRGSRS